MVKHNPEKKEEKKSFSLYIMVAWSIFACKKRHVIAYSKMKIYSKND